MKGTQKQFIGLLKKAGLQNVEVVEDESQSDFELDTALSAIDESRSVILKPLIEQELSEQVKKSIAGKVGGALERELKRTTGIDVKLFTPDMSDEDKIKMAFDYKNSLLEQDKQEYSKQLDGLLAKHNEETERIKLEYEGKLSESNKKYINRDIDEYIFSQLKDAPLPEGADRLVIAKDLRGYLESQHHLAYDETKRELGLYDKTNTQMPLLNEAGTSKVQLLDKAKEYLAPRSLWKEDMRHVNPSDAMRMANPTYTPPPQNSDNPVDALKTSRQQFYEKAGIGK